MYEHVANEFIQNIKQYSDCPVCIIDDKGKMYTNDFFDLQSKLRKLSEMMIEQKIECFELPKDKSIERTIQIVGCLLKQKHKDIGVLWMEAKPKEIQATMRLMKLAFELQMEAATSQQTQCRAGKENEELIQNLLYYHPKMNVEVTKQLKRLNLSKKVMRVCVIVAPIHAKKQEALDKLQVEFDSKEDIVSYKQKGFVLVFKHFDAMQNTVSLVEYMHTYIQHLRETNRIKLKFYIGTLVNDIALYADSYSNALWIMKDVPSVEQVNFFMHHLDAYFKSYIPFDCFEHVFKATIETVGLKPKEMERIIGALIQNNYNYILTCKSLFIHRNTLVYKFDKIKRAFGIDPMKSNQDREFLEYLYYYFKVSRTAK